MTASIYYFTGTGNSLYVARTIAKELGDCKVINMARTNGKQAIEDKSDTVGIVFPVFYLNMPQFVQGFIKKLKLSPQAYVFGVATCGGGSGASFHVLDGLLKQNGAHLSAGFSLKMPDNAYIGMNLVTPIGEREQVLKASDEELKKIIESLKRREVQAVHGSYVGGRVLGSISAAWAADIYRLPKRFSTNDKCNSCGMCAKVCPVGNVKQKGKKVTWGNNCTHCLACFHWCPLTAIEIGKKSGNIARYHHPAIALKDMVK